MQAAAGVCCREPTVWKVTLHVRLWASFVSTEHPRQGSILIIMSLAKTKGRDHF